VSAPVAAMVRILGIDPGSRVTGWGVIDADGRRNIHVASGVIKAGSGELGGRLRAIFDGVRAVIDEHHPGELSVERVFMARNADSALKLGQARGAAICAALAEGLTLAEYAPRQIKAAIVGTGNASKEQVQHMIGVLLAMREPMPADQSDALAAAICHAHSRTVNTLLDGSRR
jgi:crossover junction endodeoxyribonuclease RuvC